MVDFTGEFIGVGIDSGLECLFFCFCCLGFGSGSSWLSGGERSFCFLLWVFDGSASIEILEAVSSWSILFLYILNISFEFLSGKTTSMLKFRRRDSESSSPNFLLPDNAAI